MIDNNIFVETLTNAETCKIYTNVNDMCRKNQSHDINYIYKYDNTFIKRDLGYIHLLFKSINECRYNNFKLANKTKMINIFINTGELTICMYNGDEKINSIAVEIVNYKILNTEIFKDNYNYMNNHVKISNIFNAITTDKKKDKKIDDTIFVLENEQINYDALINQSSLWGFGFWKFADSGILCSLKTNHGWVSLFFSEKNCKKIYSLKSVEQFKYV